MALTFRSVNLPGGSREYLPSTVVIKIPKQASVATERLHLLAYIPWDDGFLMYIPKAYHAFYKHVLPHLDPRTTSVHTALSATFIPELIAGIDPSTNSRLTYLGVILHDCGWSKVSESQIADSLDYSGIMFTAAAAEAKRLHAEHGAELSRKLLEQFRFDQPLTEKEIALISNIALHHEQPLDYKENGRTPSELIVACEADRLWPFTHENFWLDVARKGVEPAAYIQNVATSIEGLFLTKTGREIAWRLMHERMGEVAAYQNYVAVQSGSQKAISARPRTA